MAARRRLIRVVGPIVARAIAFGPTVLAALLSLAAIAAAIHWGAFVAGGSDSNCYLTEARLFRSGSPVAPVIYDFKPSWSHAALSLAPTGFAPSNVRSGALAPICAPGLGFIMGTASLLAGDRAAYGVVPICGALIVWCAFVLGSRLAAPWIGVAAAALTLVTPIFLFQLFQPMSDVPAAAGLLVSLACLADRSFVNRTVTGGVAAGLAVLIRPNLAPLLLPLAALASAPTLKTQPAGERLQALAWFAAGTIPGVVAMLVLNAIIYGSPLQSGYGDAGQLFAVSHVAPNLARYPAWLIEICSPWILVGLAAPILVPARTRSVAWTIVSIVALLLAIYLPYSVFQDWTYVRFLLPGVVMLTAASSAATYQLLRRLTHPIRIAITVTALSLVFAWSVRTAQQHGVFTVWQSEARFVDAARWVERNTPPGSVVMTIWHSGSVRYHGNRTSLVWDAIEPVEFDAVVAALESQQRPVYLLLESWERAGFAQRFRGATRFAELDWPPRAQIGRDIALYDLDARDAFHRGQATPTERVFTTAERAAFRR